jgi:two-component system, sensor histidine kinase YesM
MKFHIFKFFGIRKKLIGYFLLSIFLLGLTSIFSYYNAKIVLKNTNSIISDYVYMNDLKNDMELMITDLQKYLTSASSEDLLNYYNQYNKLKQITMQIPTSNEYDEEHLIVNNIGNMLEELMNESDKAIQAKRGGISSKYITNFQRVDQISGYINLYYSKLLDIKLKNGSEKYQVINKNMTFISYINIVVIIVSIIVNVSIAVYSTYNLTKPIAQLSRSAEKIAEGEFDIELTQTHTGDETDILASAFIKMVKSIRNYIDELKQHAEIEKKLKEQEYQNLKMQSLLKEAELKFLQSQINPHFLFNTLNAASQLAMIEGADKSSDFIENIAELFRYNLKNIEDLVPLREEVEYVKNYMHILKIRFGSRITFKNDIFEDVLDSRIPRMTIQPIVENAFIHGLQDLERDGEICLNVKSFENYVLIEVIDNGQGMDLNCINNILRAGIGEDTTPNHVTGIGTNNVLQRLRILFNASDNEELISIESKVDQGTKVTLKIPKVIKL